MKSQIQKTKGHALHIIKKQFLYCQFIKFCSVCYFLGAAVFLLYLYYEGSLTTSDHSSLACCVDRGAGATTIAAI